MRHRQLIQQQIHELLHKAAERPGEGGAIVGIGQVWLAATLQAQLLQSDFDAQVKAEENKEHVMDEAIKAMEEEQHAII